MRERLPGISKSEAFLPGGRHVVGFGTALDHFRAELPQHHGCLRFTAMISEWHFLEHQPLIPNCFCVLRSYYSTKVFHNTVFASSKSSKGRTIQSRTLDTYRAIFDGHRAPQHRIGHPSYGVLLHKIASNVVRRWSGPNLVNRNNRLHTPQP